MLRVAMTDAQDANIEQIEEGLRDLAAFREEIESAKPQMTRQDREASEFVLQQVTELEEHFNEMLAEAQGTRVLISSGPVGSA